MANIEKKVAVEYVLKLSEEEAAAVCAALCYFPSETKGDQILYAVYKTLAEAGAESDVYEVREVDDLLSLLTPEDDQ